MAGKTTKNEFDIAFGKVVKNQRRLAGYQSQEKFVAAMSAITGYSMSIDQLRRIESGRQPATVQQLEAITSTLKHTPGWTESLGAYYGYTAKTARGYLLERTVYLLETSRPEWLANIIGGMIANGYELNEKALEYLDRYDDGQISGIEDEITSANTLGIPGILRTYISEAERVERETREAIEAAKRKYPLPDDLLPPEPQPPAPTGSEMSNDQTNEGR